MLLFVSGAMPDFIEGVGEEFGSIPRAIWRAASTLTTVGNGDIYPITVGGKVAAGLIALAGIGVVALPTGIFASAFSDELRERERARKDAQAPNMARTIAPRKCSTSILRLKNRCQSTHG